MSVKKYLHRNKNLWIVAFLLILLIKIFSWNKTRVESLYSRGFYIYFSKILRFLFGWIPFSFGDILYLLAGCWIIWKIVKIITSLSKREMSKFMALKKGMKLLVIFAFIYIVFNIFWGINYDRKGIVYQLNLADLHYDTSDLKTLQKILLEKVNSTKLVVLRHQEGYPSQKELINRAEKSYQDAASIFPFLKYENLSVKSSLYGIAGDYLGFTGYYNPFTGEAQINTTVPDFLQPYIATHEMAHQLGYAKENEANFVGYLAAVNSKDTLFHYSTYLELFLYANREVYYFDTAASRKAVQQLIPPIKQDILEMRKFDWAHESFLEPAINWMYGNYLKLNNQPKGLHSYNAVVGMLIAYYKKYGKI